MAQPPTETIGVIAWQQHLRDAEFDKSYVHVADFIARPASVSGAAIKSVLMFLSTYAGHDDGRHAHPGVSNLATATGYDRKLIGRALTLGCELGWIRQVRPYDRDRGRAAEYELAIPPVRHEIPRVPDEPVADVGSGVPRETTSTVGPGVPPTSITLTPPTTTPLEESGLDPAAMTLDERQRYRGQWPATERDDRSGRYRVARINDAYRLADFDGTYYRVPHGGFEILNPDYADGWDNRMDAGAILPPLS